MTRKLFIAYAILVALYSVGCATARVGNSKVRAWFPFYGIEATKDTVSAKPVWSIGELGGWGWRAVSADDSTTKTALPMQTKRLKIGNLPPLELPR